jgi:hypothetical protein
MTRHLGTYLTAKRLGLAQSTVSAMCRDGRMPGAWLSSGGWRIPEDAVPSLRASTGKAPT